MPFFLQFLLIFAVFPSSIFGIECAFAGICYNLGTYGKDVFVLRKTCNDSCVYFKCIRPPIYGKEINVAEGAGCYNDFKNFCPYTPTKYKDEIEIEENLKKYSLQNEILIFKSCSDKDGCATTNGFDNWKTDNKSDGIFGSLHTFKDDDDHNYCLYDNYISIKDIAWCKPFIKCHPSNEYTADFKDNYQIGDEKNCDGCLLFKCTNDGGNTVIAGGGCFDVFEYACPSVPSDIKEKIKKNIKNSFYFDKNYIVASSSSDYYDYITSALTKYEFVNPKAEEIFQANLNKDYDKKCHAELPQPSSSDALKIFTTFGFAIIIIKFWLYL